MTRSGNQGSQGHQTGPQGQQGIPAQAHSLVAKFASRFGVEPDKMIRTLKATAFKQAPDRQGVVQEVSNEEMMALLVVANEYELNPWTREIYAFRDFKRGGIVPIISVDGWTRIVNSRKEFDGMEFDFGYDDKGNVAWAECTMYRKDRSHPIKIREFLKECKRNTDAWDTMPHRMLRHRAMIQCGRVAFSLVGIYDEDEGTRIIEGGPTERVIESTAISALNAEISGNGKNDDAPNYEGEQATSDTFATIADKMNKAARDGKLDEFDLKVIDQLPDEAQRLGLQKQYEELNRE